MRNTIDTAMARSLVEACAIRGASIIGRPGGWSVMLKLGMSEKALGTQRTDKPRMWRSLDTCAEYVKTELHIKHIDGLDMSNYSASDSTRATRADSSERLKHAHEAAAYDTWFRAEIEAAIVEADDPNTKWVSNEDANKSWAKQRAELVKRAESRA